MHANIPGLSGYIQPSVITRVRTLTKAVSIPGGLRTLCLVGTGETSEVIIDSAVGDGTDGFNPDFSTQSDGYGRFFQLSKSPIVENRTKLFLNGSQLRIVEDVIDGNAFSAEYDARIDPSTGEIEMQSASLINFGTTYYKKATTNSGDGYLSGLSLLDQNAPSEVWTIRCVNTLLDSYGAAIRYQATFIASGSISGQLKDAYGQPFIWRSDCNTVSNGIISFAICNPTGYTVFEKGDKFTIQVSSRALQKQDELSATYIAEGDLNVAETFNDPNELFKKHGSPSVDNTLSLGAQFAFNNGAPSVLAIQAKPPLPRRTVEIVLPARNVKNGTTGATGSATIEDLIFEISAPGKPDVDTNVHFFILNTDGTEQQIFPNKVNFYNPDIADDFSDYERDVSSTLIWDNFMNPGTSGYAYSYTIVSDLKVEQSSNDGAIAPIGMGLTATFSSNNISLSNLSVGKIIDAHDTLTANLGRFEIISVTNENTAVISRVSGTFASESSIRWQLLPEDTVASETSQRILLTSDLALSQYKGLRVTYIDQKDANFFDPNWSDVLDVLETQDLQILVPLPLQTVSSIQQSFKSHVEKMSSMYYKRERIFLTGALQGLTVDNVLGNTSAAVEDIGLLEGIQGDSVEEILDGNIEDLADYSVADGFGDSYRVVYMYPDEIIAIVGGSQVALPGYYMAAAAGGWLAGQTNIAMPMTMKTLNSFTIANNKVFKQEILNKLGAAGITVCQPIIGGAKVLHNKTTIQSGYPEEEEVSIIFIRDQLAIALRKGLQVFIGQPEDPTLLASITAKVIGILNAFTSQKLITQYRKLSVKRDDVEPRQWNVYVEVQPNYGPMWIFNDINVGLF